MSNILSLIEKSRASGDFSWLADAIPYTKFLGISPDRSKGQLVGKMTFSDKLIGNPSIPALHGGSIGALLESAAVFSLLWNAETITVPKTINISIEYLRSGKPMDTFASGTITKQGRRVATVHAVAWQESPEKLIATANAHFLITPKE